MKIIQSEGGPLIGIRCDLLKEWGGITELKFAENSNSYGNDYEALCFMLDESCRPSNIGLFSGKKNQCLLINIPNKTAIIDQKDDCVYIAQVEVAERNWSFESVERIFFKSIIFDEKYILKFYAESGDYVFFDAAYSYDDVQEDCLRFYLNEGNYAFKESFYKQDDKAELLLYMIEKMDN